MAVWGKHYEIEIPKQPRPRRRTSKPLYATELGAMYCGKSEKVLKSRRLKELHGQAQLIFTSPPFPLNTKKRYGNLQGDEYVRWFARFAPLLREFLVNDGSIVIEIGNAWEPGRPVMSTTVLRALLAFLERGGLHLCQEFVWYNSARLPSPVEWVNKERIRVKDAFTRIWWMSPTERPKADNRKVLKEYSPSMKRLIETGKYNAGARPSEHHIGAESFKTNNNGAIPPNVVGADEMHSLNDLITPSSVLKAANTGSRDTYRDFCNERGASIHPARMPRALVEFFLKFLTEEGDLVLDPFGGSNTTGATAEQMGRRWVSVEAEWEYAVHSIGRFDPEALVGCDRELSIFELVETRDKDRTLFDEDWSDASISTAS
ncbi:MAG: site-specific DNA-methyltransferase [Sphingomonadales bacterium]|nr:site-specific DNA-methyltransferase [Sphingomonadales bacterium]